MSAVPRSRRTRYAVQYNKLWRAGYRTTHPVYPYTRMVQALHTIGYTRPKLQELTGLSRSVLEEIAHPVERRSSHQRIRINLPTAKVIEAVYAQYSTKPISDGPGPKRVRAWARKHGWAPPMAWDDIYDKDDYPKGVAA